MNIMFGTHHVSCQVAGMELRFTNRAVPAAFSKRRPRRSAARAGVFPILISLRITRI